MKKVDRYVYPKSSREKIDGLRHYSIDGSSERLPSVTTILGQTKTKRDREALENWKRRVGEIEADRVRDEVANRGTAMHKYLENLIRGTRSLDLTTIGQDAQRMAEIIVEKGLNDCSNVYGIEAVLYYPGLYAGSCDLIASYNGKLAIIDFKQTNKPKQREWIGYYFLQMAAYGMAHDAVYDTAIELGIILMCSKDGYYQQFVIEGKEFRDAKHEFLRRLDQFYGG